MTMLLITLVVDLLKIGWKRAFSVFVVAMFLLWLTLWASLQNWYALLVDLLTPHCSR